MILKAGDLITIDNDSENGKEHGIFQSYGQGSVGRNIYSNVIYIDANNRLTSTWLENVEVAGDENV